jgi:5-methyltetrahydrofolate--homocysteine methyltransferase
MLMPARLGARELLETLLSERILVLDGAMGTLIQAQGLDEAGFRGERFRDHPKDLKGCNDLLVLTQPQIVEEMHRQYLEAGADIVETNTFNATPIGLAEYGLAGEVFAINKAAALVARRAAEAMTRRTPNKPRFVAGSIGPTNKSLSLAVHVEDPGRRDATFDQMVANYSEQVAGLVAGAVDLLLAETSFDTLVMKACLFAIDKFFFEHDARVPVMVSGTVFEGGRTLSQQSVEAFWISVAHFDMLSIGLNCAVGVDQIRPHIETLSKIAPRYTSCHPNAGLPDGFGAAPLPPGSRRSPSRFKA